MPVPFPSTTPDTAKPLWQILWAPMLLMSLGLHGVLLLLPIGGADQAVMPGPDPEQDSVTITRVPPDDRSTEPPLPVSPVPSQAAPTAPPTEVGAPTPVRQRPAAAPARSPAPQPAPPATAAPPATSSPDSTPATPPEPTLAEPPDTPPPASSTAPSQPLFDTSLGEQLLAHGQSLNLPQAQIERALASIQERFVYDAEAASPAAYEANLNEWTTALQQHPDLVNGVPQAYPDTLSVTYYQRACLPETPGTAKIGAVVNPAGETQARPVVLQSSGYGELDRLVMNRVRTHTFPQAADPRAYTLEVETDVNHGQSGCLDPDNLLERLRARV